MTPFDGYISKNRQPSPLIGNNTARALVIFSLALSVACIGIIYFFPSFATYHWGHAVEIWAGSVAACLIANRRVGKWALLGIPVALLPAILLYAACFMGDCI